ncbi:putative RNA methyltransferase [Paractinoplanes abujensis]|uniref:tRNA/tmRNA/rRNA uracil-C5-methylase (TrmA/RlmC/RlmD family) n=1 Tax=Paractinoplanes abujensis TaxID=882441 RepID=A0A7W7G5Y8_9ACTN|nr:TRAM domain-containing protein [Actinoplanes abujensis]MBB4697477.1 tRNA/tmRNA/rRNA uracil-C5-methylase (TrmA/RlmC/RlmD family) [Actinoplanes abujensis]GID18048.1 putative RNA methyltransferase [Actinoplanes abujensis]
MNELQEGDLVELTVGAPAHGGHCVARVGGEHGQVVFVRHALPGERVTAEITELHKGFARADAVTIHEPSPDRVEPPCPYARPGLCGGCDLQHASGDAQRRWKAAVVEEQLRRLAKLTYAVRVEELPGGLLGWRSRVRYAVDAAGRAGLLKHRSHEVVAIDRCRIAHPGLQALDLLQREWPDADALEAVASTGGDVTVLARPTGSGKTLPPDDPAEGTTLGGGGRVRLTGPGEVTERAAGREWRVPAEGFWQVHPAAAETLVSTVVEMLRPAAGETVWDLYGGAGLFAGAVAEHTHGRTTVVEASHLGAAAARENVTAEVVEARVDAALSRRRVTGPVDLVVLDPPRAGAGAKVVRSVVAAGPRAVAYVACDPAALARDIATFRELGWNLVTLRAFDCFPMTQHVECVALLEP